MKIAPLLLRNCWYLAVRSAELKTGRLLPKVLLGDPVVLGRDVHGKVFALRNICPHRGMPLSHGRLQGCELQCCYHGWKFNTGTGVCTDIPSMSEEQDRGRLQRITVRSYPVRELQGNIWIFMAGDKLADVKDVPPVPFLRDFSVDAMPAIAETQQFRCHIDHAAIGLVDPAHVHFVHTSWWWRSRKQEHREIRKKYGPIPWGYRMERVHLKQSAKPYKLLGKDASTEITFQLPGVRIEHITGDKHTVVSLTAITPTTENTCDVHQQFYWTIPWLGLLKPITERMAHRFLSQDRDAVTKHEEGLAWDPPLMLLEDVDTQAKWYLALKQEFVESQRGGRAFCNPVPNTVLRWRT